MYNNADVSMYIPESFHIKQEKENEINERVIQGKKISKTKKIVICGMLRDSEEQIPSLIKKIEFIGSNFLEYDVVIIENNSEDKTRELLLEWRKNNNKITILGCGINVQKCDMSSKNTNQKENILSKRTIDNSITKDRINKMIKLRQIYVDYIKGNNKYKNYDYVFVWDMDIIGNVYIDGIFDSIYEFETNKKHINIYNRKKLSVNKNNVKNFWVENNLNEHQKENVIDEWIESTHVKNTENTKKENTPGTNTNKILTVYPPKEISAICAYGVYKFFSILPIYYDTYAHQTHYDNFNIDAKLSHDIKTGLYNGLSYSRGDPLVKVKSCFSGFTIYDMNDFIGEGTSYGGNHQNLKIGKDKNNNNIQCEHVLFHSTLKGDVFMNPNMINYVIINKK